MDNSIKECLSCLIGQAPQARILDSTAYPTDRVWTVGRQRPETADLRMTHIEFLSPYVSRIQALLRYNEDDCIWEIKHIAKKSKTFLDGKQLPLDQWVLINDESIATFAVGCTIAFSYYIDETFGERLDSKDETIGSIKAIPKDLEVKAEVKEQGPDHGGPWQAQVVYSTFSFFDSMPMPRLIVILLSMLIGFALFLMLGAAVQ
jgi:hypothetical protein